MIPNNRRARRQLHLPLPQFLPLCSGVKIGTHLTAVLRGKNKTSRALRKQYMAHNKGSVCMHTGWMNKRSAINLSVADLDGELIPSILQTARPEPHGATEADQNLISTSLQPTKTTHWEKREAFLKRGASPVTASASPHSHSHRSEPLRSQPQCSWQATPRTTARQRRSLRAHAPWPSSRPVKRHQRSREVSRGFTHRACGAGVSLDRIKSVGFSYILYVCRNYISLLALGRKARSSECPAWG